MGSVRIRLSKRLALDCWAHLVSRHRSTRHAVKAVQLSGAILGNTSSGLKVSWVFRVIALHATPGARTLLGAPGLTTGSKKLRTGLLALCTENTDAADRGGPRVRPLRLAREIHPQPRAPADRDRATPEAGDTR